MSYFKFLRKVKKTSKKGELTNLVEIADKVGINHNAATALSELGMVKKKKSGFWKWVGGKPTVNKAIDVKETSNFITKKKK